MVEEPPPSFPADAAKEPACGTCSFLEYCDKSAIPPELSPAPAKPLVQPPRLGRIFDVIPQRVRAAIEGFEDLFKFLVQKSNADS